MDRIGRRASFDRASDKPCRPASGDNGFGVAAREGGKSHLGGGPDELLMNGQRFLNGEY